MPISTSTRCCLPFDAKYRIEDLRFELECHQKDSAKVRHEIQFDYRSVSAENQTTHNSHFEIYRSQFIFLTAFFLYSRFEYIKQSNQQIA